MKVSLCITVFNEEVSKAFITAFEKTLSFQPGDESNDDMSSSFRGNPALQSGEDVIRKMLPLIIKR